MFLGHFTGGLKDQSIVKVSLVSNVYTFLTAGKSLCELDATNVLVHAKDRGGLWTVNAEVLEIFCAVETHFRHVTSCAHRNIDSQKMVSELLRNSSVSCNFNKLCNMTTEKVSKEIAFNLLEQLVLLYIRVPSFSWVKSRNDLEKIKSKKKNVRSLRTDIKKASSILENGH